MSFLALTLKTRFLLCLPGFLICLQPGRQMCPQCTLVCSRKVQGWERGHQGDEQQKPLLPDIVGEDCVIGLSPFLSLAGPRSLCQGEASCPTAWSALPRRETHVKKCFGTQSSTGLSIYDITGLLPRHQHEFLVIDLIAARAGVVGKADPGAHSVTANGAGHWREVCEPAQTRGQVTVWAMLILFSLPLTLSPAWAGTWRERRTERSGLKTCFSCRRKFLTTNTTENTPWPQLQFSS